MPKAGEARTSALSYDGAVIFVVPSNNLTLHTAQSNQNPFVCPCDGTIVDATARVIEAAGSAAGKAQIGTQGGATAIGEHSFATSDAAGVYDILSSLTTTTVNKGDRIVFGTDGASTSTGQVSITLTISPNAA